MPVYLVTDITVHDFEKFAAYAHVGRGTVAQFGGKLLAGGVEPEVIEGKWSPKRMSIVEFESREAALAFYNSHEYQAALKLRLPYADYDLVLVPGAVSPLPEPKP